MVTSKNLVQQLINQQPPTLVDVNLANPTIPLPPLPPAKSFSSCQTGGGLEIAFQNFFEAYDTLVFKPTDLLKIDVEAAQNVVLPQLQQGFKTFDKLISVGQASAIIQLKFDITKPIDQQPVTPPVVPINSLTTEAYMEQLGFPFVSDKASAETSLAAKGINVVNGLWLKSGSLELSCVGAMHRLVGGNPCVTLFNHLNKPAGRFTFMVTTKVLVSTVQASPCPPKTVINTCTKSEVSVEVEVLLATDATIDAVLASNTHLTRDDLIFYIFWNETIDTKAPTFTQLKNLGFTIDEITDIWALTETAQLKPCVIKDPIGVLNFLCGHSDDAADILSKGPGNVDPEPTVDDLIDDILNKVQTPQGIPGLQSFENTPLLVLSTLNVNKTFSCRDELGQVFGAVEDAIAAAATGAGQAFDAANAVLDGAQGILSGAHNQISNLLTAAQDLLSEFPGSMLGCLFPGSGFGLSLPFPKDLLTGLQVLLGTLTDQILGLFDAIDALLAGLLTGLCISASLIGVTTGGAGTSAIGAGGQFASTSGTVSGAVSTVGAGAIDCSSFELDWPDFIKDLLQCLLKLLRMLEEIIQAAINALRNLIATLQNFSLEFGFQIAGAQVCTPAEVLGALAAIEATLAGT